MATTRKRIQELTVAEVMTHKVVALRQDQSMSTAARVLANERISGGPVVDERGKCIGVLSAVDFLDWAGHGTPQALTDSPVRDHMTEDVVTTSPETLIHQLARKMVDAHVHRVIVTDEQGRPIGIVSSTNILAAVAYVDSAK